MWRDAELKIDGIHVLEDDVFIFFKKSGNILYGMMWMLMPLSFWASGGDGGVGITIEMAFSSCGNPTTTQ